MGPLITAGMTVLAGRYRLEEELGAGGMARVYRARDLTAGRDVAVKVFRSDVAAAVDPRRLDRERTMLESVESPVLVKLLDTSGPDAPVPYVVVELVEGEHLGHHLARGPLRLPDVRRVIADVADALDALRRLGVVHRDVKPANILLPARTGGGPAAKLTDLGTARVVDGTLITAPTTILGTPAYLSPKQVRGEPVGPPADVYALGLVLFECLTGRKPFPGPPTEAALARLTRRPVLPAGVPDDLAALVLGMTAADPLERPVAGDVATALRDGRLLLPVTRHAARVPAAEASAVTAPLPVPGAASPAPVEAPPTGTTRRAARRRRHRLPWYAAIGSGSIAAAALTVIAISASVLRPQGPIQALPQPFSPPAAMSARAAGHAPGAPAATRAAAAPRAGTAQATGPTAASGGAATAGSTSDPAASSTPSAAGTTRVASAAATGAASAAATSASPSSAPTRAGSSSSAGATTASVPVSGGSPSAYPSPTSAAPRSSTSAPRTTSPAPSAATTTSAPATASPSPTASHPATATPAPSPSTGSPAPDESTAPAGTSSPGGTTGPTAEPPSSAAG